MQSTLDAKAFASITDSVTQLLLLREVLCTSELSTTTTAGEALLSSATPNPRASGAVRKPSSRWGILAMQRLPGWKGPKACVFCIVLTQAGARPAWKLCQTA